MLVLLHKLTLSFIVLMPVFLVEIIVVLGVKLCAKLPLLDAMELIEFIPMLQPATKLALSDLIKVEFLEA
jgi:hypothetical protein